MNKELHDLVHEAINTIDGITWDLEIINNFLFDAVNEGSIKMPDNKNDPIRILSLTIDGLKANLNTLENEWEQKLKEISKAAQEPSA